MKTLTLFLFLIIVVFQSNAQLGNPNQACPAYGNERNFGYSNGYIIGEVFGPNYNSSLGYRFLKYNGWDLTFMHDYRINSSFRKEKNFLIGVSLNQAVALLDGDIMLHPYIGHNESYLVNPNQINRKFDELPNIEQPASSIFSLGVEVGLSVYLWNRFLILSPEFNLTYFTNERRLNSDSNKINVSQWVLRPAFGLEFLFRVW